MTTIEQIKEIDIPINIRRKNNLYPASDGLVLYNNSVNLYKAIALVISEVGLSSTITNETAQDAVGSILLDSSSINFTYDDATPSITGVVIPGGVDHDALLNFVANKHIDHSTVSIIAGTGLTGGGNITASRTISLASSGVTAGSYGDSTHIPTFTVDATGRITAASSVNISISSSSITNFNESIDDRVAALLVAGTNVTLSYNDVANTLTINASNSGTVTAISTINPSSGFTVTGGPITTTGTLTFTLTDDLLAVENLSTTGIAVRSNTSTWLTRSIAGVAGRTTITNGSGVSGNPTIDLSTTSVVPGTYGAADNIPVFTVDAYGRLTAVTNTPVTILSTQVTDFIESVQDTMNSTLVPGSGMTIVYDDTLGTITLSATGLTNEVIDDRVAALLVAGTNVTLSYNDVANTLTINSTASGVSGSGGPYQVPYWNAAGTSLISVNDFIFDGANLGINTPTVAVNSILTTKGISAGALSWGYSHLDVSDNIVFSVADNGEIALGDASNDPLTLGNFGMTRTIGYYLSTGSGNIQLIPAGIVHVSAAMGINTSTVGSNKLRVSGSVRFDLTGDATGDTFYRDASGNFTRLGIGTNGYVLTVSGGLPSWQPSGGGGGGLPAGSSGNFLIHNGTSYISASPITETQTGITGTSVTLASAPLTYAPFTLYRNGLYQVATDDYTVAGTSLSLTYALSSSDKITALYYI